MLLFCNRPKIDEVKVVSSTLSPIVGYLLIFLIFQFQFELNSTTLLAVIKFGGALKVLGPEHLPCFA